MLTSGELAKQCNVSLRTVQFYDQKGVLKPTCISDGGKRLYNEQARKELERICMYRSLGFTLKEVISIMHDTKENVLEIELNKRIKVLCKEKNDIEEQLAFLSVLVDVQGQSDIIQNIECLRKQVHQNKNFHKNQMLQYTFLALLIVVEISLGIILSRNAFSIVFYNLIVITLLVALIFFHSKTNAYICPVCQTYFEIGFFRDVCSLNNGRKGKILKCPSCGNRGTYKEICPHIK